MKYALIFLISSSCWAKNYTVTRDQIYWFCQIGYLKAIDDIKKYVPVKVRKQIVDEDKALETCMFMIKKNTNIDE